MVSVLSAVRDLGRLREISAVLVRHGFGEIVARAGFGRDAQEARATPPARAERRRRRARDPERRARARRGREDAHLDSPSARASCCRTSGRRSSSSGRSRRRAPDVLPAGPHHRAEEAPGRRPAGPVRGHQGGHRDEPRRAARRGLRAASTRSRSRPRRSARCTAPSSPRPRATQQVVVKVQRPGVGSTVARDLELLHIMAAAHRARDPRDEDLLAGRPRAAVRSLDHERAQLHRSRPTTPSASPRTSRATPYVALPEGLQAGVEQARAHARVLRRHEDRRGASPQAVDGPSIAKNAVGARHQDDLRGRLLPRRSAPRQHHHPGHARGSRSSASSTSAWSAASRPSCATAPST